MLLRAVIQHAWRTINDHETIGAVRHLVMCFAGGDKCPLQVQPAAAPFHLELQFPCSGSTHCA